MKTLPIKNSTLVAIVDDEDYAYISQFTWSIAKSGHIYRYSNSKYVTLAEQILNFKSSINLLIDHKDCNTLNNQKSNLRICNKAQNGANKPKYKLNGQSKYKGVCWHKQNSLWLSYIKVKGSLTHLGTFKDEVEAAKAYDNAAKELFGEFARLNFQ